MELNGTFKITVSLIAGGRDFLTFPYIQPGLMDRAAC